MWMNHRSLVRNTSLLYAIVSQDLDIFLFTPQPFETFLFFYLVLILFLFLFLVDSPLYATIQNRSNIVPIVRAASPTVHDTSNPTTIARTEGRLHLCVDLKDLRSQPWQTLRTFVPDTRQLVNSVVQIPYSPNHNFVAMCRAHVLRFSCSHGILMNFEPCRLSPCPVIKTCGEKLPQQPYRCYNCQHRKESKTSRPSTRRATTSCAPDATILDSEGLDAAAVDALSPFRRAHSFPIAPPMVYAPLPNVAKQPSGSVKIATGLAIARRPNSANPFKFTCQTSDHFMPPHYLGLPSHLPHQGHSCPPCQLQEMRSKGESDAYRQAAKEHPRLTVEMLIRGGNIKEWQEKPTLEQYTDEKLTEEREMWVHVTRKWTQDLKRARVLVSEEDGLGLLP